MATISRNPVSVFSAGSWSTQGGGVGAALVTVVTDANDATYVHDAVLSELLLYEFADITGVPASAPLTSVILVSRWQNPSAGADGSSALAARIGGGNQLSPAQGWVPGFTDYSYVSWTGLSSVGDYNASQFGAIETNYSAVPARLVELYATITYQLLAGIMPYMLLQVGALIALGLHELPKVAAALARQTGHRLHADEYEQAWRELQAYRHPRFYFL